MKQEILNLTAFSKKENRRALDFYPTPPECTIALLNFLELPVSEIWEPACGEGSISEVLKSYGHKVYSSDIHDYGYGSTGEDFLEIDSLGLFDAIITNPPFNLAQQFIEKAIQEVSVVALLLKSQFWHAKARVSLFNANPPAYVLPLSWRPDFLFNTRQIGERASPTMEVAWTVWIKGDTETKYQPLYKPKLLHPKR